MGLSPTTPTGILARCPARRRVSPSFKPILRSMTTADIIPCVRLIHRAMNLAEARQASETFHYHFSCRRQGLDDGRTYHVMAGQASIVGLVGLHHYAWEPPENVWLAWFAVDPDHQGRGLGTFLLNAITEQARQLGFQKLFVETYSTPEFAQARTFYRAHGFAQVGKIRAYLPDSGDMIVFYKELQ